MRYRSTLFVTLLIVSLALTVAWAGGRLTAEGTDPLIVDPPPQVVYQATGQTAELEPLKNAPLFTQAAPASDSCGTATSLNMSFAQPGEGSATVVNTFTEEGTDPILLCAWGTPPRPQGFRTAWYVFRAGNTGLVTITTADTNYDTIIGVFSGDCAALNLLACSDDFQGFQSTVVFSVRRGGLYFIEVADYQPGVTPQAQLRLSALIEALPSRWNQIGNIPRGGLTRHAIVTYNTYLYLIGGQITVQGVPVVVNYLQRFDARNGRWRELTDMPGPGYSNTTAVQIGGKIYVPGGYNGNNSAYDGTHWVYDIATDFWSQTAPIPPSLLPHGAPYAWASAAPDPSGASYYLTGGLSSQPALDPEAEVVSQTLRFTPATNSWQALTPMSAARYAHTAAYVQKGNRGLCVAGGLSTGEDANGDPVTVLLTNGECYNPNAGSWLPTGQMNFPRYNAGSAIGPDGNWYVFGGMDVSGAVPETEVYDPLSNNWQLLDSSYSLGGLPTDPALVWPRGALIGISMYVFGGNDFPERRIVSAVRQLNFNEFTVPLANRIMLPMMVEGTNGGANLLDSALPLGFNAPARGNFVGRTQFYNAYYFDLPVFFRVNVRLKDIPAAANFNVSVYDMHKTLLGRGNSLYGGEKLVPLTLNPGRYYVVVERIFPSNLPDPNQFYTLVIEQ